MISGCRGVVRWTLDAGVGFTETVVNCWSIISGTADALDGFARAGSRCIVELLIVDALNGFKVAVFNCREIFLLEVDTVDFCKGTVVDCCVVNIWAVDAVDEFDGVSTDSCSVMLCTVVEIDATKGPVDPNVFEIEVLDCCDVWVECEVAV